MNRKERGHAEKLVARLVADGMIELVAGAAVDAIVDDVGNHLVLWGEEEANGLDERGEMLGNLFAGSREVAEVFATDEELQTAIDRWKRAVRGPEIVVTDARNPEIEAKLAVEDDDELAAVYADWLIEHGNPLGELFACHRLGDATDDKARRRVLAKHGALVWGPIADYVKLFDFTWSKAGIAGIAVERTTAYELEWGRVIGALLDRPVAAFCRSLSIGPLPADATIQFEDMLEIVAARARPTLREVAMDCQSRNIGTNDLARGYPNLTALTLVSYYVQSLVHPGIERLTLRLHSIAALENAMARAELPRLRTLALAATYPSPGGPLGKIVDMPWFNQLEELDVRGLGVTRQVLVEHYGRRVSHLRIV